VGYAHDIFISYRRDAETRAWLENHFLPLLKLRVGQEIGRQPTIFVDDQLESGVSWPEQLGVELGQSKILVALWAKDYFASTWCTEEMVLMLARESECGLRSARNPRGLVVPAVIHDGADFPRSLSMIQRFEIQDCFNVRMARDSARAEQLDAILSNEAAALSRAINAAPPWREEWPVAAATQFRETLFAAAPSQEQPPGFSD
jgi:TIR domain